MDVRNINLHLLVQLLFPKTKRASKLIDALDAVLEINIV